MCLNMQNLVQINSTGRKIMPKKAGKFKISHKICTTVTWNVNIYAFLKFEDVIM